MSLLKLTVNMQAAVSLPIILIIMYRQFDLIGSITLNLLFENGMSVSRTRRDIFTKFEVSITLRSAFMGPNGMDRRTDRQRPSLMIYKLLTILIIVPHQFLVVLLS